MTKTGVAISFAIPNETIALVQRFAKVITAAKGVYLDSQRDARRKLVYPVGVELSRRSDELVSKMERGQRWLDDHKDHPQYRQRDDEWIGWLREYEFIQDALSDAKEVL